LQISNCRFEARRRGRRLRKFAIINLQLAIGFCAQAQGDSSLSESKVENQERTVTSAALLAQNEELRRQLSVVQESLKTLTASLAESNAEAELFRRKYADLELRMEALGLASADKDRAKLEQRLLAAVGDLQLMQKERDESRDQMLRLNESIFRYLQTSAGGDAQARMEVEAQLRSTNALITKGQAAPLAQPGLMDGSVISVKEEWSLVVGNIGETQGVKVGMPLRVMRGDHRVATLKVVDVRQRICGAIVQQMDVPSEKIKVGDRLQVDAHSDVSVR
jgi:hypothetical protein